MNSTCYAKDQMDKDTNREGLCFLYKTKNKDIGGIENITPIFHTKTSGCGLYSYTCFFVKES